MKQAMTAGKKVAIRPASRQLAAGSAAMAPGSRAMHTLSQGIFRGSANVSNALGPMNPRMAAMRAGGASPMMGQGMSRGVRPMSGSPGGRGMPVTQ